MYKNYLKTAIRNLWSNKAYSFLNIFGLAIGITCAGFIFLWIEDEKSFDQFHEKKNVIYKVMNNQAYEGQTYTFESTPGVLAPAMQRELPSVKKVARTNWNQKMLFAKGEKSLFELGFYGDSSLFSIFTIPIIEGNPAKIFSQLQSLAISQKMAEKFFPGEKNVVGKALKVDNKDEYVISAVFQDLPLNSNLKFDWVAPFEIFEKQNDWLLAWNNNGIITYVEMDPRTDINTFNTTFSKYIVSKDTTAIAKPFLFALNDWRLKSKFTEGKQDGGRITVVNMFNIVAWIIIFIACINFMNLATARSEKRSREIGVRKVLGANRTLLIGQFVGEAIITAMLAVLLSVLLLYALLPLFNTMVEKQLSVGLEKPTHLIALLIIGLTSGLVAGSYPAIYLSSFNPIYVFKGQRLKDGIAAYLRKGLVVLQFTISIILIIFTIVVYQQLNHIKGRNLGYTKDNLVEVTTEGDIKRNFTAIRNDLIQKGTISNAGLTSSDILHMGSQTSSIGWEGKDESKPVLVTVADLDPNYIPTTNIEFAEGRNFNSNIESDSLNVIINETLAKLMKRPHAVGSVLYRGNNKLTIVGVVKDFLFGNIYRESDPLMFFANPKNANLAYFKFTTGLPMQKATAQLQQTLQKYNPAYPPEFKFVDDEFNNIFKSESLIGRLSRVFSILAIIISCLGLLGLAAYTAERRTREVGVRKVLGASVRGITMLLSKDFLKLVIIAILIAFPASWFMLNGWLRDIPYHVSISPWVFVGAGLGSIAVALLTVSSQAIRAAVSNPVKSLRTE